jgi:DNA-binding NtrC family response regulator
MNQHILIIDDEPSVCYSFQRLLSNPNQKVDVAHTGAQALKLLAQQRYDLIILDIRLPDISGLELLPQIKSIDPRSVVLVITAFGTTETAIEAIKLGAYDYILKPLDAELLRKVIDEALASSKLMHTEVLIESRESDFAHQDSIIGQSPIMQEIYKMIGRVAGSDVNILIRGESGTGKELVARAIYQHSQRADRPFIAVNCAAIPETLLESELFGYEKGAFTGALNRKIGKFEQANGGTIFLDEIGDMTLATQAKILRVLQEGYITRLGGEQAIPVNVRIIVATNRDLEQLIAAGRFREDLYYRIKVLTISLPPLRQRLADLPELIDYFLDKHCHLLQKNRLVLSDQAFSAMQNYHWPGNVRELENTIRRAIVLCKSSVIDENLITAEFETLPPPPQEENHTSLASFTINLPPEASGNLYNTALSSLERELFRRVMTQTGGNLSRAAQILGLSRMTLRKRLAQYGLLANDLSLFDNLKTNAPSPKDSKR